MLYFRCRLSFYRSTEANVALSLNVQCHSVTNFSGKLRLQGELLRTLFREKLSLFSYIYIKVPKKKEKEIKKKIRSENNWQTDRTRNNWLCGLDDVCYRCMCVYVYLKFEAKSPLILSSTEQQAKITQSVWNPYYLFVCITNDTNPKQKSVSVKTFQNVSLLFARAWHRFKKQ